MSPDNAMLAIGAVLIVIGLVMNVIPVRFNEGFFGKLDSTNVENIAATLRIHIGGALIAIGFIAIYNRNLHAIYEAKDLVFSLGIGVGIFLLSILLSFARGFVKKIPIPPMVLLPILIIIALYSVYIY